MGPRLQMPARPRGSLAVATRPDVEDYVLCMCPISGNAEIATRAPHLHSYKLRRAIHYMAGKVFPLIEKRDEWGSRLWSSYRVYAFGGSRSGKHGLEVSS
jgi:hypothetical protein